MIALFERMVLRLPWTPGRQSADYKKMRVFEFPRFRSDCWLIYYPHGASLPRHVDRVPGRRHWRLNITLVKPRHGGCLISLGPSWRFGRLVLFRSDQPHWLTEVDGWRLVLSFGWAR